MPAIVANTLVTAPVGANNSPLIVLVTAVDGAGNATYTWSMDGASHTATAPVSTLTYVKPFTPPVIDLNTTIAELTARIAALEAKAGVTPPSS